MNEKELAQYIGECLNPSHGLSGVKSMIGSTYFMPKKSFDKPVSIRGAGLQFDFKLCKKYNTCQIIYDEGADTFIVVFFRYKMGGLNTKTFAFEPDTYKNVKVIKDVFFDELRDVFERNTGLYVML